MKQIILRLLIVLTVCSIALSQTNNDDGLIELTATFEDQTGAVFAVEFITFSDGKTPVFTNADPNGNLLIKLKPGSYEITMRKAIAPDFRAFITLTKDGPNPKNVRFVVDACEICCGDCPLKSWPKPVELPKPLYPAAAKAINAVGAVNVEITIGPDGKVIGASAVSGHPLLRAASVVAARKSTFEANSDDLTHKIVLTYFFSQTKIDESLKRRQSPFVVLIDSPDAIVISP